MAPTNTLEMVRTMARRFVSTETAVSDLRKLRENKLGFSPHVWNGIVALGFPGIAFEQQFGGEGLGYVEFGAVLTELGRHLVATPIVSSVVLAGEAIRLGGNAAQKNRWLPEISQGRRFFAMAHQESPDFRAYDIACSARRCGSGYVLTGRKLFVLDGHRADYLITVARTSGSPGDRGGLTLFCVDRTSAGLQIASGLLLDSRVAANVAFENVEIAAERIIGEPEQAADILDPVIDRGAAMLAAEMLGGIEECFSRTIAHLQERRQFGVPIGSFQALQHRVAKWACEVELVAAITRRSLELADEDDPMRFRSYSSAAKARASSVFVQLAADAIQLFGGVGMTDAHEIGFFLKRARVAEQTLGDAAYHRDRFADAQGF